MQFVTYLKNDFVFHDPIRMLSVIRQDLDDDKRKAPDSRPLICTNCKFKIGQLIIGAQQYFWDEIPYRFCLKTRDDTVKPFDFDSYL